MFKDFLNWIVIFNAGMSLVDWIWRLITILILAGGSTTTYFAAKQSDFFKSLGNITWIGMSLITSILIALVFYLINLSSSLSAQAEYTRIMATHHTTTNPLSDNFVDQIIHIEDLRLPTIQLHENKHFKRCKLIGPGAIVIQGGTYSFCSFIESGDIIVLPDNILLTGITILRNCTVENSEFFRITLFVDKNGGEALRKIGAQVRGLTDK
jgi:hypothetical protein